jgi:type III pantothenate kinase
MLLTINANNTNTVLGLCDSDGEKLYASWRVSTQRDRMPDEWFALIAPLLIEGGYATASIQAVIIGSVVPSASRALVEMARRRLTIEAVEVGADLDIGVRALVDNPREVGPDRLANTVAAFTRYGGPAIVVDFGTATNFDVVSTNGDFLGGAIAPGLMVSLDALTGRAARLFSVDLALPQNAIGTNTTTNIQSGSILGHLLMVEGLVARIQAELAEKASVIATGGFAAIFAEASPSISAYDPDLTLNGLRLIYQRVVARSDADRPHAPVHPAAKVHR